MNALLLSGGANEDIRVAEGVEFTASLNEQTINGKGDVFLRWRPTTRVVVVGRADVPSMTLFGADDCSLKMLPDGPGGAAVLRHANFNDPSQVEISSKQEFWSVGISGTDKKLAFHLVNFDLELIQPLVLADQEWRVTLRSVENFKALMGQLSFERGYGLTHYGEAEALRAGALTDDLFDQLHWLLSFVRGQHVALAMIAALGENPRWQCIGVKHVVSEWPAYQRLSWFPRGEREALSNLFGLFREATKDEEKYKLIRRLVYFYCSSNLQAGRTSGGIVLAQAGMERLCWHLLRTGAISAVGNGNPSTTEKMRLLMRFLGLKPDVPARLKALTEVAGLAQIRSKGGDLPAVLTSIRNNLVHPKEKLEGQLEETQVQFEAWNAYQWLLEQGMLRLLGYEGRYRNRLFHDEMQIQRVPWI